MPDTDYTAAFMDTAALLEPLIEMVAGHRAKLELAGYSPTMAEHMSAVLHGQMLAKMFANV